MTYPETAIAAAFDAMQAHFEATDAVRCLQGDVMASFGLGPRECPYQVTASGSHWRLRDYGNRDAAHSLLVVAAPIKRSYIWDLAPPVSVVSFCLEQGLHVRLLEWLPASRETNNVGIDECIDAIARCVALVSREDAGAKPLLAGHSLGGTLATIFAASASDSIRGLVLLSAPLCFEANQNGFRDTLVSMMPPRLPDGKPFPGSLLTHMSAVASPATFIWSRLLDGMMSLGDEHATEIHAWVVRWAFDEVALPGKLVREMIECLYRDNRLVRGTLQVGDRVVGPSTFAVPLIAVVNTVDEIAPMASLKSFADSLPQHNVSILEFPGEIGACLQHLAILVGREAKVTVWPEIMAWIQSCVRKAPIEAQAVSASSHY